MAATERDVPTGVFLRYGERIVIAGAGIVKGDPRYAWNGPGGDGRTAPGPTTTFIYPLAGSPRFGLVGKVGASEYFFIGKSYDGNVKGEGELVLMINDAFTGLANNEGAFTATIGFGF